VAHGNGGRRRRRRRTRPGETHKDDGESKIDGEGEHTIVVAL
jgi:hypothetical protein